MKNFIVYNGIQLSDYGVFISGDGTFNAPERDTQTVEVVGRNGELTLDNGRYKNIEVTYPAFVVSDFAENIEKLRNILLKQQGNVRIEDTYHPQQFRIGKFTGSFKVKPIPELYAGEFDITFNCYPQRFLKSGEDPIEFASGGTIYSKYLQEAKPLIRAYGTGSFSIGGVSIQITTANGYTDIDCDLQEAYKDTLATSCNGNIVLTNDAFPVLKEGDNTITLSGVTKLVIYPRWWVL